MLEVSDQTRENSGPFLQNTWATDWWGCNLGQIDKDGQVLDGVEGQHDDGGTVISQNSKGEYYQPRIVQYNFEN